MIISSIVTNVPYNQILFKTKEARIVEARSLACWLMHKNGATYAFCGRIVGLNYSTVIYNINKINDFIEIGDKRTIEITNAALKINKQFT